MARLRRTNNVTVLTFEDKTRLANFFMLLVEIDTRLPKTAKAKIKRRAKAKAKNSSIIKCPAMCSPLRTALRDLYLALIYSLEYLRNYFCLTKKRVKWIYVPN